MYKHRDAELEQFKMIWLTKESYELLRKEKKKQKKSMAKILDNLIINNYKKDVPPTIS
jgi:hypothetical protein